MEVYKDPKPFGIWQLICLAGLKKKKKNLTINCQGSNKFARWICIILMNEWVLVITLHTTSGAELWSRLIPFRSPNKKVSGHRPKFVEVELWRWGIAVIIYSPYLGRLIYYEDAHHSSSNCTTTWLSCRFPQMAAMFELLHQLTVKITSCLAPENLWGCLFIKIYISILKLTIVF